MKNYFAIAVLGVGLVGCTASDRAEVKQETREAGDETRARTTDMRREYETRMQSRLDKIDREMEEEREQAKNRRMNAQQRRDYERRMAEMEETRADARRQWEQFKNSTDENWEQFKDGLDRAGDKLENGWNKFVADMRT